MNNEERVNHSINQDIISETFQPVEDDIDFNGSYHDAQLITTTPTSEIYRVTRAGKTMLLKVPTNQNGRILDLLKREYSLGVGLDHHNIATVYTWEASSPMGPGILMEYVDGRTLRDFVLENPSLKARQRVFSQLLDAVNYIHKHGITHNDLKPGNIMVSRANDDVKIIDFGLADADGETIQRQLGGTLGYSSPELRARNRNADMRSDIYSLGVIMRDIFPDRYRSIWQKCISENPDQRYPNVDDLIKAWNDHLKRPTLIWISAIFLLVMGALVIGGIRTTYLQKQVDQYSQSSQNLTDTISALRITQTQANDTIAKLNQQLSALNQEKSLEDSLTSVYKANAQTILDKYLKRINSLRCLEETVYLFKLYNEEMDTYDEQFLKSNPAEASKIHAQFSQSVRLQGLNELDKLARTLPPLSTLTSDPEEISTLMPLVLAGKPWRLKSDTSKVK